MKKGKTVAISVGFGIAAFIVAFALGSILTASTGIPLIGGLLNGILTGMVLAVGMLVLRNPGAGTLMWLTFAICAIWTTTLGPPGVYKIVIALIAGGLWDIVYRFSKYRLWGLFAGGVLGSASIMLTLVYSLKLGIGFFGETTEALEKYESAFWALLGVNLVITLIGIYLGKVLYDKRLKDLSVFRKPQD